MGDTGLVTLTNDSNIIVLTTIVSGRLQLSINGIVLGEVDDTWDPGPPPTTRMTISNLPDGTQVSAQWQNWDGTGPWTPFILSSTGCFYDFPNPPGGGEKDIRFTAQTLAGDVCDPKFVLRTKVKDE